MGFYEGDHERVLGRVFSFILVRPPERIYQLCTVRSPSSEDISFYIISDWDILRL